MASERTSGPEGQRDGYGRIFLLSHMRALTSLVSHILGSHRWIAGYYEMHRAYADAGALDAQRRALEAGEGIKPDSRFLFDKILHNDYAFEPERLGAVPLRLLVTLRAPDATLRSIVHLFAGKPGPQPYASPAGAGRYYVTRLRALAAFCRATPLPYDYFDAELLQQSPAGLLASMTDWLELDPPLSGRYDVFRQTGQARSGDSSPRLFSGVIDTRPSDYAHIALPADVLDEARDAYFACRRAIAAGAAHAAACPDGPPVGRGGRTR